MSNKKKMERMGKCIKNLRRDAGMDMTDLATLCCLDPMDLVNIESGSQMPDYGHLCLIAKALNVYPSSIEAGKPVFRREYKEFMSILKRIANSLEEISDFNKQYRTEVNRVAENQHDVYQTVHDKYSDLLDDHEAENALPDFPSVSPEVKNESDSVGKEKDSIPVDSRMPAKESETNPKGKETFSKKHRMPFMR